MRSLRAFVCLGRWCGAEFGRFFRRCLGRVWKMWKRRLLWRTWVVQAQCSCGWGRGFHKSVRESTWYLAGAVEELGNRGRVKRIYGVFSNCPELHSRVLEKSADGQSAGVEGVGKVIHFSFRNDGDYGIFI